MADWVTEETRDKQYSDIPGLKSWLVRDLKRLNIIRPTPVQFACIPPALAGRDVIGGAKTGSGKTMAFVLPILNKLSDDPYGIFALILTPTRELAFQITDQFRAVGSSMGVRVTVV
ncbi:DEAD/DEAH box helicase domain, partial [Trinorchestia longiramus]